jgi:hypothetical protein
MSDMLRQAFKALDLEKDREGKKGLMPASEARERTDNARALNKSIQSSARSGGGGGGGGGMNPIDLERVPGKRPLKMKKVVQSSPQLLNEPMVLLKKAKPVEKWCSYG